MRGHARPNAGRARPRRAGAASARAVHEGGTPWQSGLRLQGQRCSVSLGVREAARAAVGLQPCSHVRLVLLRLERAGFGCGVASFNGSCSSEHGGGFGYVERKGCGSCSQKRSERLAVSECYAQVAAVKGSSRTYREAQSESSGTVVACFPHGCDRFEQILRTLHCPRHPGPAWHAINALSLLVDSKQQLRVPKVQFQQARTIGCGGHELSQARRISSTFRFT